MRYKFKPFINSLQKGRICYKLHMWNSTPFTQPLSFSEVLPQTRSRSKCARTCSTDSSVSEGNRRVSMVSRRSLCDDCGGQMCLFLQVQDRYGHKHRFAQVRASCVLFYLYCQIVQHQISIRIPTGACVIAGSIAKMAMKIEQRSIWMSGELDLRTSKTWQAMFRVISLPFVGGGYWMF